MLTMNNILFPTDFSASANYALLHALYLAARHHAELHMLHILNPYDDPNNPTHHFPSQEEITSLIQNTADRKFIEEYMKSGWKDVRIIQQQLNGLSIAPAILDYVVDNNIDFIVMGTHGRRGIGHMLLGSVAEEVVRLSPCPVFTVKGKDAGEKISHIQRVLIPVDFSGHARRSLMHAKQLALLYGAELQILHVIEEVIHPAFYASGRSSIFEFMPQIEAESTKYIQQMVDEVVGKDVPVYVYLREGNPTQEIIKFVEHEKSDLLVIATHGLTGIEHFLLGSVAEKVVRLAPVPVFTVKGFGKTLVAEPLLETSGEHV